MNFGQFFGIIGAASNIVADNTSLYTKEMFVEDFPQFAQKIEVEPPDVTAESPPAYEYVSWIPNSMLDMFIAMANSAIQEAKWFIKWRFAMGLFIAHYATLYLRSFADGTPTAQSAAMSGTVLGLVKSATLGDSSVSYDTSAIAAATEDWGAWNSTTYGQLLVTEARLVGMGGMFII
jgi:hypothetical protein